MVGIGANENQGVFMKQKFLKPMFLLVISVVISIIPMMGYYPFVAGWMGAISTVNVLPFVAMPFMIATIHNYAGMLAAMKYGTILVTTGICLKCYKKWFDGNNTAVISVIVTFITMSLEIMDWWMNGMDMIELYGLIPIILLTWSTTVIFTYFVKRFMWVVPRKVNEIKSFKQEQNSKSQDMLRTSQAIKNLARNINRMSAIEQLEYMDNGDSIEQAIDVNLCRGCENGQIQYLERARLNYLWYNKMLETREAMAIQLNEMADIMEQYTKPSYKEKKTLFGMEDYLKHKLHEKGVIVRKVHFCENSKNQIEIRLIAKKRRKGMVDLEVMERTISKAMGKKMRVLANGEDCLTREFKEFTVMEELNFITISGAAKKARHNESCSGDNYAYVELDSGQTFMSICDGMGSGERAAEYSELVIDLLEQLLESGFAEDSILKLINSVLLTGSRWQEPAAVDMALIDNYSGICQFLKLGAASTYVKRGNWVECITSTSLPIGVLGEVDVETITKKLYNGDFIIMVSDGIVEALNCDDKEGEIGKIIMDIETASPREMAFEILTKALEKSEGIPKDDMTVLCTGIWDKI